MHTRQRKELNYSEEMSLACYMHAADGVMDISHDDMDYTLLQLLLLPLLLQQDRDRMEVEVAGLELGDADYQVCGKSLQADRAEIHCE